MCIIFHSVLFIYVIALQLCHEHILFNITWIIKPKKFCESASFSCILLVPISRKTSSTGYRSPSWTSGYLGWKLPASTTVVYHIVGGRPTVRLPIRSLTFENFSAPRPFVFWLKYYICKICPNLKIHNSDWWHSDVSTLACR